MDYKEYEKYMNDRKAVTVENNRRIEKKFAECEKWVADNLIGSRWLPISFLLPLIQIPQSVPTAFP